MAKQAPALTPEEYIANIPADKKEAVIQLRKVILKNLPKGFQEVIAYGMIGYVIPHSIYPKGYHVNPKLPLGLTFIAAQKNAISLHHLGVYASPKLLKWFTDEYPKHSETKLDMGKGCIRFKNPEKIPYKLVGELMAKLTVDDWITQYEAAFTMAKAKAKATKKA